MSVNDWQKVGFEIPLLLNMQPAGEFLGEAFFRSGGVPAVMGELLEAKLLHTDIITVNGKSIGENIEKHKSKDTNVIKKVTNPIMKNAGFIVLSGNLFDSALMKTSVILRRF